MLFNLGRIVATPGAIDALNEANQEASEFLRRHITGDWGELGDEDKELNDLAVYNGDRIFSAYVLNTNVKIWVITEHDRSLTTILLQEEY